MRCEKSTNKFGSFFFYPLAQSQNLLYLDALVLMSECRAPYKYISILSLINYLENGPIRRRMNKFKLKTDAKAYKPQKHREEEGKGQCETTFGSHFAIYKYINCLSMAES